METEHAGTESGFVERVARGFVYFFVLNSSLGLSIAGLLGAFDVSLPFAWLTGALDLGTGTTVQTPGALLSLGIAAILVHSDDPLRLAPFVAFGLGSAVLSTSLFVLLNGTGRLAPLVADVAPWLVGPAVAFALVYLVGWAPIAAYARPT